MLFLLSDNFLFVIITTLLKTSIFILHISSPFQYSSRKDMPIILPARNVREQLTYCVFKLRVPNRYAKIICFLNSFIRKIHLRIVTRNEVLKNLKYIFRLILKVPIKSVLQRKYDNCNFSRGQKYK